MVKVHELNLAKVMCGQPTDHHTINILNRLESKGVNLYVP